MGCKGCGGFNRPKNPNLVCVNIAAPVPGRYQKIVGSVTGIDYGWRSDSKVMCLDKRDLTSSFVAIPDCTRCG